MGKHDVSVAAVDGAVERGCSWTEGMVVEWWDCSSWCRNEGDATRAGRVRAINPTRVMSAILLFLVGVQNYTMILDSQENGLLVDTIDNDQCRVFLIP